MSILYLASHLTTNPLWHSHELEYQTQPPPDGRHVYYPGTTEVAEASSARTLGNSFKILAEGEFTGSAQGVIVSQGSRFGGYTLFVKNGKLIFIYNFLGIEEQRLVAEAPTIGKHLVGVQFDTGVPVTGAYKAKFDFSGGRVIKVIYHIVNDAHVNVERAMAAKMARD